MPGGAGAEEQTPFTIPIDSAEQRFVPQGKLRVARSRDGGRTWKLLTKGLPQFNAHVLVLREAMSSDDRDPAGIYFGTSTGTLFYSRDGGNGEAKTEAARQALGDIGPLVAAEVGAVDAAMILLKERGRAARMRFEFVDALADLGEFVR